MSNTRNTSNKKREVHCHSLGFLHFEPCGNSTEKEFSSDADDWNDTKPTPILSNKSIQRSRAAIVTPPYSVASSHNTPLDEPPSTRRVVQSRRAPSLEPLGKSKHAFVSDGSIYPAVEVVGSLPATSARRKLPPSTRTPPKNLQQKVFSSSPTASSTSSSQSSDGINSAPVVLKDVPPPDRDDRRRNIFIVLGILLLIAVVLVVLAAVGVFTSNKPNVNTGTVGADGDEDDNVPFGTRAPSVIAKPPGPRPSAPTVLPTAAPVDTPTENNPPPPPITYEPGLLIVQENGLILSKGLKSRLLAQTGFKVQYQNGGESDIPFHIRPDGAATFSIPETDETNPGGWIYVSNSEGKEEGSGGVGAITFNKDGNAVNYKNIINGTTMNCSGGKTPWNTWVSCEEYAPSGQIYQIDPFGNRPPEKTTIGIRQVGRYEAFTYDDRDEKQPVFYVTEDQRNGPTRRFRPELDKVDWENDPWSMLHGDQGKVDYLVLSPNSTNGYNSGTYGWVDSIHEARANAYLYYQSAEGIDRKDHFLYMACKREKVLFIMDLDTDKYVRYSLQNALFDGEPDQITRVVNDTNEVFYFQEDLGSISGVHARNPLGQMFTILEGTDWSNEVTGVAFSPSGRHMYLCFQEDGVMFEITREDGYPFSAATLNVRYHNKPVESYWNRRLGLIF